MDVPSMGDKPPSSLLGTSSPNPCHYTGDFISPCEYVVKGGSDPWTLFRDGTYLMRAYHVEWSFFYIIQIEYW